MDEKVRQDLALVRQIMEQTRQDVTERGRHFVVWGLVTAAGLLATHVAVTGRASLDPTRVWLALLGIGWAASLAIGFAEGRRSRVRTLGRRVLSAVWITAGIALTLVAIGGLTGSVLNVRALPGVMSMMLGAPVMLTGLVTGERWLSAVAVSWWVAGVIMLFVPGVYTLLLMAGLSLLLLAVPGAVLYTRSRRSATAATAPDAG